MNNRKIKFALVGCGRIAQRHIEAIRRLHQVAVLSDVVDTNPVLSRTVADETKATGHLCLNSMLAASKADVVILTTPSGLHADQAIKIAKSGRHVITEKPMALRWSDGLHMVEACKKAMVHLFVVKQNRFKASVQLVKKAIDQGRFGKIYMVNINVFWTRPQSYFDSADWRGTKSLDGGALLNQASHYVDLLTWLFGPVRCLNAYTATLGRNIEVEDTAVVNLAWESGALGSLNTTMLTYPKNIEASMTVIGEKGTLKLGGAALDDVLHWQFADWFEEDSLIQNGLNKSLSTNMEGHLSYYEHVIEALCHGKTEVIDGTEGLKSLEILAAAYLSARDGKQVNLPLSR